MSEESKIEQPKKLNQANRVFDAKNWTMQHFCVIIFVRHGGNLCVKVTNSTRQSTSEHGKIRPGIVKSRGWHKNQIRRSFQVNQCLSPNSKFIGELNFVIHRWSKYLRQWKCYIFFALNRGWPEMFSNNRAIPKYWSFLQNKIAFGAWLWPIGAEMENKPSNCWLWLKANENAQEPIGS